MIGAIFGMMTKQKKVKYRFYEPYHREHKYISIDRNDDNDLSYWKHCKIIN